MSAIATSSTASTGPISNVAVRFLIRTSRQGLTLGY